MVTTTQTVLDVHLTVQSSSILNNYSHSSSCHSQQDRYNPGNNYSCIFGQSSNSLGHRTTLFFALHLILSQLPRSPPLVSIITREQYKLSYAILFFPPHPEIGNTNFKCALWSFKQQLALKCEHVVEFLLFSCKRLCTVVSGYAWIKFNYTGSSQTSIQTKDCIGLWFVV